VLMIYTGADLIRTSGQHAQRAEKLELVKTPAVEPASSNLDDSTQDALKRFARFINDKKPKKPRPYTKPSSHPYKRQSRAAMELDRGQLLDIFA
jgi:hypothetical protein